MSILITLCNIDEILMVSDSRETQIYQDSARCYNEHSRKVFRFNQTLVGANGNADYFRRILDDVEAAPDFPSKKRFYQCKI